MKPTTELELFCPECDHRVILTEFCAHKGKKNIYVCIECGMTFWYEREKDELHRFVEGES